MHKQLRAKDEFPTCQLSLLSFADDTTLLARGSDYASLEDLLCDTLQEWKETIKPSKTKRMMIGRSGREVDRPFVDHAKLLGAWLQDDAGYAVEDAKRLEGARALWRSLCRQLPRYGLTPAMKGRVVQAAVVRSLLYSTESRVLSAVTIKKWQCFLNTIARGLTGRRLRDMEGNMTMQDVLREAHLDTISTYIEVGQLNYLGHVARLPANRLERALLFGWLPPEAKLPAAKQAPSTRRYFWSLLKSAMEVSNIHNWEQHWMQIASAEGGSVWKSIVTAWRRRKRQEEHKLTWQEKRSAAATAARQESARERAFKELGARPAANGKYTCPHCCNPPVTMFLRSLRTHVAQCAQLSQDVRARQALQRQRAQDVPRDNVAPRGPLPPAPLAEAPVAVPNVVQARPFKSRRKDDWDPVVVREAYKKRFPHRQMSLTDLPAPQIPDHLDNMTGLYCLERFPTSSRCSSHTLACAKMPYKEWLGRVRICQHDFRDSKFTCTHCGTGLATPKAVGKHSTTCAKRRTAEGLSLNAKEFFDL